MAEAEVLVLPGIERRDIGQAVPSSDVLKYAMENGVTDVIVIGRHRDGGPYIAAECHDADAIVGKLIRAANILADSEVIHR